jgi:TRAP-type C4-dicarboxylate transport system substrate-binding protein
VAPEYGVINLPMAFDDTLMLREGAPQALAEYLSQFVADRGMQVMGLMRTADPIFIFRDRYIETPEAMNNTKIRVTGGRILQELIRGLGASPITMPATEMATALMQGTIDGILTSYGGWEMVGTNAAPRATWIPGLSLLTYTVLVDRDWLAGLPEDLREIVIDTTEEMLATQWRDGIAADVAKRDEMLAMGGTLHEVDSAAREEFRARALEANQIFTDQYPEVWAGFQEVLNRFSE